MALVVASTGLAACSLPRAGTLPREGEQASHESPPGQLLAGRADRFQRRLEERHLAPEGLLVYRRVRPLGEPGPWPALVDLPPASYGNLADGAIWTSCYLAAEAFRYGATRDPAALAQVRRALSALEILTEITGKRGFYARCFDRGDAPAHYEAPRHRWRQGRGRFAAYRYRADVSKDQYSGLIFGLATTHAVVEDPRVRESCRRQLEAIADHLLRHGQRIVDAEGEMTPFGDVRGIRFGVVPVGVNALISLAALKAASAVSPDPRYGDAYAGLVLDGYLEAARWAKIQVLGKTNHSNDLMSMLSFSTLLRYEADPGRRARLVRAIDRLFQIVGGERNSLFNGIYCAQVAVREDLLTDARESLLLFADEKIPRPVDLLDHPGIGRSLWYNRKGIPRADRALPMNLRPVTSFNWKSCPYALVRGVPEGVEVRFAGCDYLLAYWLLRYHGLLAGPETG